MPPNAIPSRTLCSGLRPSPRACRSRLFPVADCEPGVAAPPSRVLPETHEGFEGAALAPGGRMLAFSGSLWVASAGFPVTGPAAGRHASSVGSLLPFLLPAPPCLGAGSLELEAARVAPTWPPPHLQLSALRLLWPHCVDASS